MIWEIQEYQGILALDRSVVERLQRFLELKESDVSRHIIESIHPYREESLPPHLDLPAPGFIHLNEAVEQLGKKIHRISRTSHLNPEDWKIAVKSINSYLWDYVEILVESATELFQQLEQVGFEHWNVDLFHVISSIKEILAQRIDEAIPAVKNLEAYLREYRGLSHKNRLLGLFSFGALLDRSLISNLWKAKKYLGFESQRFHDKYTGYIQLYEEGEKELRKYYDFKVLPTLDIDFQERIKKLHLILTLWEKNLSARALPRQDTIRAIRRSANPDEGAGLLKDYLQAIKSAVFEKSRLIKRKEKWLFKGMEGRLYVVDSISAFQSELFNLRDLIERYRDFFKKTDPKLQERFFKSFGDFPIMEKLNKLLEKASWLDHICELFADSLERDPTRQQEFFEEAKEELNILIHEMGQPLISQNAMRTKARALLNILHGIDELGSSEGRVVEYVSKTLSKAIQMDWKHRVLNEFEEFHNLYNIHEAIIEPIEDRKHLNRLNKFKRLTHQISHWIRHGDSQKHFHDIELDINDIKGYLQDFYAHVQRLNKEERIEASSFNQFSQKLLEYQYLFSEFFFHLQANDPEERNLRKQLLFVDQYFENILIRLNELEKNVLPEEF